MDSGKSGLNIHIGWSTKDGEKSRHFYTSDQYMTEEEAKTDCIAYGQLIIDGKIHGSKLG